MLKCIFFIRLEFGLRLCDLKYHTHNTMVVNIPFNWNKSPKSNRNNRPQVSKKWGCLHKSMSSITKQIII